jgi:hypothetical protein
MAKLVGPELVGIAWRGRCVVRTQAGITDWPINRASAAWEILRCQA